MRAVLSALFLCGLTCVSASAQSKLAPDLLQNLLSLLLPTGSNQPANGMEVIIQWKPGREATGDQKITALGGKTVRALPLIHGGVYAIPSAAITALQNDDTLVYLSPVRNVKQKLALSTSAVNAQAAWSYGLSGAGIGVVIIDSGMNDDDNLGAGLLNRIAYSEDLTNLAVSGSAATARDSFGHGQHVAGIIASNGRASSCLGCTQSYVGVAPGVTLVNLRVLDADGAGSDASVIAALQRAIEL
jgi:subtilisin family serine protease